jgi:hypothetical protein
MTDPTTPSHDEPAEGPRDQAYTTGPGTGTGAGGGPAAS